MTKPVEVSLGYDLEVDGARFSMQRPFVLSGDYTLSGNTLTVRLREPTEIEASVEYTGNAGAFRMTTPYEIDVAVEAADRSVKVTMEEPLPVSVAAGCEGAWEDFQAALDVNWNTRDDASHVHLDFAHVDQSGYWSTDRSVRMRVATPLRTVSAMTSLTCDGDVFAHSTSVDLFEEEGQKFEYSIHKKGETKHQSITFQLI